jgi:hypothetical protein
MAGNTINSVPVGIDIETDDVSVTSNTIYNIISGYGIGIIANSADAPVTGNIIAQSHLHFPGLRGQHKCALEYDSRLGDCSLRGFGRNHRSQHVLQRRHYQRRRLLSSSNCGPPLTLIHIVQKNLSHAGRLGRLPGFHLRGRSLQQHALLMAAFMHNQTVLIRLGMFQRNIFPAKPTISDAFFQ